MSRASTVVRTAAGGLLAAAGFLTVLSVPEARAAGGRRLATVFFPLVGAALGLLIAGIAALPVDTVVAAILALLLIFVLTGGLHWDAWGDVLDACVTAGMPRARRIEILGDPRAGSHAVVGLALVLLLAVSGLARAPVWGIVVGSALGRWMMVATLRWGPPLERDGAAARMRGTARPIPALCVLVGIVVGTVALGAPSSSLAWTAAWGVAVGTATGALIVLRLGGLNGDGHGAVGLLTEVGTWVVAAHLA